MNRNYPFLLLLICASCAKKISINPELNSVENKLEKRMNIRDGWWDKEKSVLAEQHLAHILISGISEQDAVRIAIYNNLDIQESIQQLGITKGDLIQAGFYSNPVISSVFKLPIGQTPQADIEVIGTWSLSDLWQVPLRKKISEDELEIQTRALLQQIVAIAEETKLLHAECIYLQERIQAMHEIEENLKNLYDRIVYRKQFGYTSDIDTYHADIMLHQWQTEIMQYELTLTRVQLHLKNVFNIQTSFERLPMIGLLNYEYQLPALKIIESFALRFKPELQIARLKIIQADHQIAYERSRIVKNVTIGLDFERDFDRNNTGLGPFFSFDIPLFDTNYGNIEHAKYQKKLAEKTFANEKTDMQEALYATYATYETLHNQLAVFNNDIVVSSKKSLEYVTTYVDTMEIDMIVLLNEYYALLQNKLKVIDLQYELVKTRITLERIISAALDAIV